METEMKPSLLIAAALGTLALSACASDDEYYYGYGPPMGYADLDYSGWYDGYYGPFVGGYWAPGGVFYYYDRHSGRYHRDHGHHFSRERAPGYNPIHGHAPPAPHHAWRRPG